MKKKKVIIIAAIAHIVIAAAVFIGMRMFGDSHAGIGNEPEEAVKGDSKTLVAYFSWSGNGQQMARWIAEETGGELFRIVPSEPYGEDYGACADRAKDELDSGIRPELSEHIDADVMAQYDVAYLGFPGGMTCPCRFGRFWKSMTCPERRLFPFSRTMEAPTVRTA